jgi:hypothetical protein
MNTGAIGLASEPEHAWATTNKRIATRDSAAV